MPQQLSLCFPSTPQKTWLVNVLHSELCQEITSKNSNYSLRKICMFLFGQGKLPVKRIQIQVQHKDSLFLKVQEFRGTNVQMLAHLLLIMY